MLEKLLGGIFLYTPIALFQQGIWGFEYTFLWVLFLICYLLLFVLMELDTYPGENNAG